MAEENTRNIRYNAKETPGLLTGVSRLYIAKGRKVIYEDLSDRKPGESIAVLLLGPSGYLRAPACRKGGVFMVGFDEQTYRELFL